MPNGPASDPSGLRHRNRKRVHRVPASATETGAASMKKPWLDERLTWEARYRALEKHHVKETTYLIEAVTAVTKLADRLILQFYEEDLPITTLARKFAVTKWLDKLEDAVVALDMVLDEYRKI